MKKEITYTAADLFLNLGFKSVTMDDIANKMGISKKTIYAHFPTKSKLVEATTYHLLETIDKGIEEIRKKDLNPIAELFEIKKFVMHHLKDEKSSPQFQLNKYYPRVYEDVQKHHLHTMHCSIADNLEKGINGGYYRQSIPVDFISKFYFVGMMAIKNNEVFPVTKYSMRELTENYLEYHLRAIVTPKGFEKLKEFLTIVD
ncbi:TetR/AcrR family transcriptional regulator [Antarcticibacterium flavum]|uniref:TetR/AcrR family transcriptional regulator n=1 Tax=Antarcticibacterium flavum TaxID=2058175 RepID=A0A5B7X3R4_9FLAO|nr:MULTISPECIES: TetR/AcrR family transcriptional regulator [Antarcticibacterium]MCM4159463.1 TetR family transcriptional regulator [Antarcticibacterium sp. W02-3]QCY69900.1 TetR/AcrR family transcriptional regulator [Antarcticibacterium flavum]